MITERDFTINIRSEVIEIEGRGGKFVCKWEDVDRLILALVDSKGIRETAATVSTMPKPQFGHLRRIK